MSRIDVGALTGRGQSQQQQVQQPQSYQPPEIDIQADDFTSGNGQPQEQQQKQPDENTQFLRGIHDTLQGAKQQQDTNYQQLLSDPDVAKLLLAKQNGKKPRIVDEDQNPDPNQPAPQAEEPEPDWDKLRENPQQMASYLTKNISREVVKGVIPLVKGMVQQSAQQVEQLSQNLTQIGNIVLQQQRAKFGDEIEQVRQMVGAQEFDALRPVMSQLSKEHQGLSTQDLFVLARTRTGLAPNFGQSVSTERPTSNTAARPPAQSSPHPQMQSVMNAPGGRTNNFRANFDRTLAEVLDRTPINYGGR